MHRLSRSVLSRSAPSRRGPTTRALSALLGLTLAGSVGAAPPAQGRVVPGTSAQTTTTTATTATSTGSGVGTASSVPVTTVVAVSIDGLRSSALRQLGAQRAPVLHRLVREGATTLNARTAREQTDTLPNHTGMVTSRRINAERGGHGVTWNDDRTDPPTVHAAAGERVESVFSVVGTAARGTGLFASKTKFTLFDRSWGDAVDRFVVREDNGVLVRVVRRDLREHTRAFRFVHLSGPDKVGHRSGWRSAAYLDAVATADALLGRIVATLEGQGLTDRTVLLVTADHGGSDASHRDPTKLANYRVPFLAWGAGVAAGADLYALNSDYADPGRRRTGYATAPPPVRNAALANLVTDLLALGPVPGSEINARQDLDLS